MLKCAQKLRNGGQTDGLENVEPQPRRTTRCTVRAITKATGESWEHAYVGICLQGFLMCDMPSNNAIWGAYIRRKGFNKKSIPEDKPDDYTVEDFCRDHPQGVFIVTTSGHVLTVQDGDYYDSWNSGKEIPIYYFEREEQK